MESFKACPVLVSYVGAYQPWLKGHALGIKSAGSSSGPAMMEESI